MALPPLRASSSAPAARFGALELVADHAGLGQYFGTDKGLLVVRAPDDGGSRLRGRRRDPRDRRPHAGESTAMHSASCGPTSPAKRSSSTCCGSRKRMTLELQVPAEGASGRSFHPPGDASTTGAATAAAGAAHRHRRVLRADRGLQDCEGPAASGPSASMRAPCGAATSSTTLPEELIARHPLPRAQRQPAAAPRWRAPARCTDRAVRRPAGLLRPGDLLVFNDTRVIPARLLRPQGQRRPRSRSCSNASMARRERWCSCGRASRRGRARRSPWPAATVATVVERDGELLAGRVRAPSARRSSSATARCRCRRT